MVVVLALKLFSRNCFITKWQNFDEKQKLYHKGKLLAGCNFDGKIHTTICRYSCRGRKRRKTSWSGWLVLELIASQSNFVGKNWFFFILQDPNSVIFRSHLRHDYTLPAYHNDRDWRRWYLIWCFGHFSCFKGQKLTKLRQFIFFNNNNNNLNIIIFRSRLGNDHILPAYRNDRYRSRWFLLCCFDHFPCFIGQKLAK